MYPIALDLSRIRIVLVGSGEAAARRMQQLKEAGTTHITPYLSQLPEAHEIRQAHVLLVVGLDDETSTVLASIARLQGILVNVEDKPELCDFYFTSFVKRGDLMLAVSTNGASPTLAQEIKAHLAKEFGEEWEEIVSEIAAERLKWKKSGCDNKTVGERTRALITARELLSPAPEHENA